MRLSCQTRPSKRTALYWGKECDSFSLQCAIALLRYESFSKQVAVKCTAALKESLKQLSLGFWKMNFFMLWSIFKCVFSHETLTLWSSRQALRHCRWAVKDHLRLGHCEVLLTFSWPYCGCNVKASGVFIPGSVDEWVDGGKSTSRDYTSETYKYQSLPLLPPLSLSMSDFSF